jgi:thioredoxin-like negative regulator of GroEL
VNDFLAKNQAISFLKIDGGVHVNLMKQLNIEGIPTLILLKNGQELWRHNGIISESELAAMWQEKK